MRRATFRLSAVLASFAFLMLMAVLPARCAAQAPKPLYVSPLGDDANDGSSWDAAKQSVQAAVDAVGDAGEVWVSAGSYQAVTVKAGVALYGGFDGTETERGQRNPAQNATLLGAITSPGGSASHAGKTVDGFTISGAVSISNPSGLISNNSGLTVAHCTLNGGVGFTATLSGFAGEAGTFTFTDDTVRGGVNCYRYSPLFQGCAISGGVSLTSSGAAFTVNTITGGIQGGSSSPTLTGNTVDTVSLQQGGAVVSGNTITAFTARNGGTHTLTNNVIGSVNCSASSPTLTRNTVTGTVACAAGSAPLIANNVLGGVLCDASSPGIYDNTIVNGSGIQCRNGSAPVVVNNVIAFNAVGVTDDMDAPGPPMVRFNDVYGNAADYSGLAAPNGADGNIQANPGFVDRAAGNFHLSAASQAVDAGDSSAAQGPSDRDGQKRIQGRRVDMGAYETPSSLAYTMPDAATALRIAAGLAPATPADLSRLDVEGGPSDHRLDLSDALRLLRRATGLDFTF